MALTFLKNPYRLYYLINSNVVAGCDHRWGFTSFVDDSGILSRYYVEISTEFRHDGDFNSLVVDAYEVSEVVEDPDKVIEKSITSHEDMPWNDLDEIVIRVMVDQINEVLKKYHDAPIDKLMNYADRIKRIFEDPSSILDLSIDNDGLLSVSVHDLPYMDSINCKAGVEIVLGDDGSTYYYEPRSNKNGFKRMDKGVTEGQLRQYMRKAMNYDGFCSTVSDAIHW